MGVSGTVAKSEPAAAVPGAVLYFALTDCPAARGDDSRTVATRSVEPESPSTTCASSIAMVTGPSSSRIETFDALSPMTAPMASYNFTAKFSPFSPISSPLTVTEIDLATSPGAKTTVVSGIAT